jgi:hypothetical protein
MDIPLYNELNLQADIWYFDSHGILILGSIFLYGMLNPLLRTDPPVWWIEPSWYVDPLIYNQEIGRGIKIPDNLFRFGVMDIPLYNELKLQKGNYIAI